MLSNSRRARGFLRVSPINSGQQIRKLRRRYRDRAAFRRRPDEPASFQFFRKKAAPLAITPDYLYQRSTATAEHKKIAVQRVQFQHLLHPQRKGWKPTPHVHMARCNPHPHFLTGRKRDHRSVSSPRMIRSSASTSTLPSTTTRRPFAATISMRPEGGANGCHIAAGGVACFTGTKVSGMTSAGTKPSGCISPCKPWRTNLRQRFNRERLMPY
ncbi:hypothetical protein SHLA_37c000030 [Shinella sp. DD12]|nr:hypothetical protein SHLA_37c000030 [Shinella sp. DD12]